MRANVRHMLLTQVKREIYVARRLSSVRCPSRGHISKTKQVRPIVTVDCYTEVCTGDSAEALISFPDAS